ncbi:MAG: hypothetical protein JWO67_6790 [Streptosporangiaceae bacterium]|nr:hypothetical protein [Streptosporangiaceae bacterium]
MIDLIQILHHLADAFGGMSPEGQLNVARGAVKAVVLLTPGRGKHRR